MTYRVALTTAIATFFLLIVGGIVHGTGSSLACPDWPLCFDQVFPEMTGGVFYEHSHRLIAAGVGALTVTLAVLLWRGRRRAERPLHRLGLVAVAVVVVQGVLGGLTVIYRLPTAVSTAHLGVSMIFFAMLIYLAIRSRPGTPVVPVAAPLRRWVGITGVAVYLQIVLGGLVRHTGGGMACLDELPLCQGRVWDGLHASAKVQVAHRAAAVLVSILVIAVAVKLFRAARQSRYVRWLAASAVALLVAQVTLGLLSVWSLLGLWQVTSHLGVGALLLANLWLLWLSTRAVGVATQPAEDGALAREPAGARG